MPNVKATEKNIIIAPILTTHQKKQQRYKQLFMDAREAMKSEDEMKKGETRSSFPLTYENNPMYARGSSSSGYFCEQLKQQLTGRQVARFLKDKEVQKILQDWQVRHHLNLASDKKGVLNLEMGPSSWQRLAPFARKYSLSLRHISTEEFHRERAREMRVMVESQLSAIEE